MATGATEKPLTSICNTIAFDVRDWSTDKRLAWIYGIVHGWDDAMDEMSAKYDWSAETVSRLRRLHASFQSLEVSQPG